MNSRGQDERAKSGEHSKSSHAQDSSNGVIIEHTHHEADDHISNHDTHAHEPNIPTDIGMTLATHPHEKGDNSTKHHQDHHSTAT